MGFSKVTVHKISDDKTNNSFEVFETDGGVLVESYFGTNTNVGNFFVPKQAAKLVAKAMLDVCGEPVTQNDSPQQFELSPQLAEKELSKMCPHSMFSEICKIVDVARRLVNIGRKDLAIDIITYDFNGMDFSTAEDFVEKHLVQKSDFAKEIRTKEEIKIKEATDVLCELYPMPSYDDILDAVKRAREFMLKESAKIFAIKTIRVATGMPLKEAKNFVEKYLSGD